MGDARASFFHANDFGPNGGYDDAVSNAELGVFRYTVPNSPARRETLRRHDLHHVLTGYGADWRGESEISAWELGSGIGPPSYAWVIALWGLFYGLFLTPAATFVAFVRGRRSTNLYAEPDPDALLGEPVHRVAERLGVVAGPEAWSDMSATQRAADVAAFMGWGATSMAWGAVAVVPTAALVGAAALRSAASAPCIFDRRACGT